MRLNKFISQAGICSRREADRLIKGGMVTINDVLELNPAYQVEGVDKVRYDNQILHIKKDFKVILLNKPVGFISTMNDPLGRKTVMNLVETTERLFPIGRLDKDTSGLLLFTNEGLLANKLMHPRNEIPRIYKLEIDKVFKEWEIKRMSTKVYIGQKEWGKAEVIDQRRDKGRAIILLKLHQGKKREIRRLIYRMKRTLFNLERIQFGPIELGKIPLGHWRNLTNNEIISLKKLF